mmetsp:Transcript_39463/g.97714  ORF Transcript_39463/g.97714 Transcript_39463/m.97714 type:complete len:83 (-) Transcript_39463:126-374(-)
MGTTKDPNKLWVNTKKMQRRNIACMEEVMGMLACLKKCNFEDARCIGERSSLDACLNFQAQKPKSSSTINHHLQRLSRMAKR